MPQITHFQKILILGLLCLPSCKNLRLLPSSISLVPTHTSPRFCAGWLKTSKCSGLGIVPACSKYRRSRRQVPKCITNGDSGDAQSSNLTSNLDKTTRFSKASPVIVLARSLSRFFSSVIAIFCSKYGPIQRFLRGFIFEFKVAKRAWRQESKRTQEEFRRKGQVEIFESLSEDEDAEDLSRTRFFQGYQVNDTDIKGGTPRRDKSIPDDNNEQVWENEEARFEYEQSRQFYSALGILDTVDEVEDLLSSEYDKFLTYTEGTAHPRADPPTPRRRGARAHTLTRAAEHTPAAPRQPRGARTNTHGCSTARHTPETIIYIVIYIMMYNYLYNDV